MGNNYVTEQPKYLFPLPFLSAVCRLPSFPAFLKEMQRLNALINFMLLLTV
jgi:hypothetical protein